MTVRREIMKSLSETGAWSGEREASLKQDLDRPSGEPARWHAMNPHASLSQRRIHDCSRSVHE
jgi:hypothetical protein